MEPSQGVSLLLFAIQNLRAYISPIDSMTGTADIGIQGIDVVADVTTTINCVFCWEVTLDRTLILKLFLHAIANHQG